MLILTRDPVAGRIDSVVVAAPTRTRRGLVSELQLTPETDGVPTECVANFDNLHTLPRSVFRRRIATLDPVRMVEACRVFATPPTADPKTPAMDSAEAPSRATSLQ